MIRFFVALTIFLTVMFPAKIALAFSCFYGYSPALEARFIAKNDLVIKGKVLDIEKPSFWTRNFSDYVFTTALIEPVDVYKGDVNHPIRVVNTLYKQDKSLRKTIGQPPSPALNVEQTYVLALKYDEQREAYIKQDVCGKLPEFKFLSSLKEIDKIDGIPVNHSDAYYLSKLKSCNMYFTDKEITHRYSDSFKYYKEVDFDEPVILIGKNDDSKQPIDAVYFQVKKDDFAAIGKYETVYFYFSDCLD